MNKQMTASELSLSEIRVGTIRSGEPGLLVCKSGHLIAILTEIDEQTYSTKGRWFLEAGFGLLSGKHRNFDTLEEAVDWVDRHSCFPSPAVTSIAVRTG